MNRTIYPPVSVHPAPVRGKGDGDLLILSRRHGESIMIDDDIKITVIGIGHKSVTLSIDAPKERRVQRINLEGSERTQ